MYCRVNRRWKFFVHTLVNALATALRQNQRYVVIFHERHSLEQALLFLRQAERDIRLPPNILDSYVEDLLYSYSEYQFRRIHRGLAILLREYPQHFQF
jgi:hypothetical protein